MHSDIAQVRIYTPEAIKNSSQNLVTGVQICSEEYPDFQVLHHKLSGIVFKNEYVALFLWSIFFSYFKNHYCYLW